MLHNVGQVNFDQSNFCTIGLDEEEIMNNNEDAVDASMNFDLKAPKKKQIKEMPFKELIKIFLSTGELPHEL